MTKVWNCVLCVATLAGVGVLSLLEIALGDFMNFLKLLFVEQVFYMLEERLRRRTAIVCFSFASATVPHEQSRQKVMPRNTRNTAFEIPGRLDKLMSIRSCLLTRRIKQSGMDEIDDMKIGYDGMMKG